MLGFRPIKLPGCTNVFLSKEGSTMRTGELYTQSRSRNRESIQPSLLVSECRYRSTSVPYKRKNSLLPQRKIQIRFEEGLRGRPSEGIEEYHLNVVTDTSVETSVRTTNCREKETVGVSQVFVHDSRQRSSM